MGSCIIFCAGGFLQPAEPIRSDDLVIAADGGYLHTETLGLKPHIILGDFDSLGYVPADSAVYPVEKDDTDSMLAVRCGLERALTGLCCTALWTVPGWTTLSPIFRP